MTAHAMAGDDQKSLAAGMDGHVTKPIDPDQLFSMLLKWIKPRERSSGANHAAAGVKRTPAESAPVMEKDSFPTSLPGFDLADGLKRLQGNHKLYTKLLVNFATKYAGMAADIRRSIDAADFNQTHGLVHSLKGMAGNLAATELQSAAVGLEKLVKHTDGENLPVSDDLNLKFAGLDTSMDQAIRSIQAFWPPDQVQPAAADIGNSAAIPPELAREAADRLRDAAEMGDISGVAAAVDELESRSTAFTPYKEKIIQLADDFDFDGILKLAGEFEKMAE
jgi:two-component system sensor histidine kinase/response regulator